MSVIGSLISSPEVTSIGRRASSDSGIFDWIVASPMPGMPPADTPSAVARNEVTASETGNDTVASPASLVCTLAFQ